MRFGIAVTLLLAVFVRVGTAAEETLYGYLERTATPGACAQITDTLGEIYYIARSDEAEKLVAPYLGRMIRVVVAGNAEVREGDGAQMLVCKSVQPAPVRPARAATPKTNTP